MEDRGHNVEAGNWVVPDPLCPLATGLVKRGGRASAPLLYKEKGRGTAPFDPSVLISSASTPFFLSSWREGVLVLRWR